jgi:hypothetical protein
LGINELWRIFLWEKQKIINFAAVLYTYLSRKAEGIRPCEALATHETSFKES